MAETENRKLDPDEMFAALSKKISDSGMDMDMGRIEAAYNMAKLAQFRAASQGRLALCHPLRRGGGYSGRYGS